MVDKYLDCKAHSGLSRGHCVCFLWVYQLTVHITRIMEHYFTVTNHYFTVTRHQKTPDDQWWMMSLRKHTFNITLPILIHLGSIPLQYISGFSSKGIEGLNMIQLPHPSTIHHCYYHGPVAQASRITTNQPPIDHQFLPVSCQSWGPLRSGLPLATAGIQLDTHRSWR